MSTAVRIPGKASIKAEFLKERWIDGDKSDAPASNAVFGDEEAEGQKFTDDNENDKKNRRGANKGRRGKKRIVDQVKVCPAVARGETCSFGENCRYDHDIETYLKTKPEDLGDRCVLFDLYGQCRAGYKCRYLKAHVDADNKLITNPELVEKKPVYIKNGIRAETQKALHKRQYKFPKSEAYMEEVRQEIENEESIKEANRKRKLDQLQDDQDKMEEEKPQDTAETTETTDNSTEKQLEKQPVNDVKPSRIGPVDTERYKKIIDFRDKTYLAPLTTVGNLPFRRICKEYGVDITCGEMAMAKNLLQGQQSEWALTKRHVSEDIFGIQICGSKVEHVVKACEVINDEVDVDFVDLNMGCPIDLVFQSGAGSALPESKGKMTKIIRGMQRMLDVPVTVKFRTGLKENVLTAHSLIPRFEDLGVALGTIHGRSRQQRYTKLASWDMIRTVKSEARTIPIYGNGDVLSFEDYNLSKERSGVDGIMIGRGALIKPWIFDEIKNQRHWDISSKERFEMMKRFCNYGLEHWGTDSQGVNITRRFFCEWQSFLYRYIPVGLLEVVPQQMNERAPPFVGRDDLETLMASPNASDWVKLSELILGPAPEDFVFIPKHKSNSFEG